MAHTTKKLLADSLKNMLSTKTLDKITVKDLCENCNVNRQTFYYNFQDIYDLMEWIFQDDLETEIKNADPHLDWQERIHSIFIYAQENKRFVLNAYHSISRSALEKYFKRRTSPIIREIVDEHSEGYNILEEDKEFITDVYITFFIDIVCEWIENGMYGEYNKKLDKLKILINGSMDYIIEKFSH